MYSKTSKSSNGLGIYYFKMPTAKFRRLKRIWHMENKVIRLWLLLTVCLTIIFFQPLRNMLVPFWPHVFREISTFKVINIYLQDLFFQVNTTAYDGSCDHIHQQLATVQMPRLEEMKVYHIEDWERYVMKMQPLLSTEEYTKLDKFKPSMSVQEQKYIMFAMLSATQAFTAFNITYLVRGGSLIGYYRHHGRMPWDEDVDILVNSNQWDLARVVLSCLPDLQINLGKDYMWKLFHKDAALWGEEKFIKFPYVDIFLYREDSNHVWPLTIWMKMITMKKSLALPPSKGVFEGWPIAIPNKPAQVLHELYPGRIMYDCYSQIFHRRRRHSVEKNERVVIPCSVLRGIYPLVSRKVEKGVIVEERMLGSQVLSTFNRTYQGFFD